MIVFAIVLGTRPAAAEDDHFEFPDVKVQPVPFFFSDDDELPGAMTVALLQEQPEGANQETPASTATPSRERRRGSRSRQSRTPAMLGDSLGTTSISVATSIEESFGINVQSSLPLAGGSRRLKIAENNSPMPQNRIYVAYNHFHNALQTRERTFTFDGEGTTDRQFHVDQYTLGLESTLLAGNTSLELRMPFTNGFETASSPGGADYSIAGGEVGNLSIALKQLVHRTQVLAISAGLGINTPTGSSVRGSIIGDTEIAFQARNEAVHLLPFIGLLFTPESDFFFQSFVQFDVPLNANTVTFVEDAGPPVDFGAMEQVLLFVDLSFGAWLYRNDDAELLTGLAALTEFHYTTALEPDGSFEQIGVGNPLNRFDVVNATGGLRIEIRNDYQLTISGVAPITDERFFDAEVQAILQRQY